MDYFENLVTELSNKSKIGKEDILSAVDKRYSEMNGLITKEGAVYLVGKEMNIELSENPKEGPQIRNITAGMRNVSVIGRIFRISKITEFKKSNGATGRVTNIFIGDVTGYIRIPFWDDQVKLIEDNTLNLGDVIQVGNAFARDNTFGDVELSLGKFGTIRQIEDFIELPSVEDLSKMFLKIFPEKTTISNVISGGNFEIKGTIAHLFEGNFLFQVCSMCNGKLTNNTCAQHGEVTPNNEMVVSFILDDGTGDLRCVLFRDIAEKFCDISGKELSEMDIERRYERIKDKILGKELILIGRVRKNRISDGLEMTVNDFKAINPLEESKRLVDDVEFMVGAR